MTSTPDDPDFTDTGDLSDKSQTAIAQLADLGITRGTSATTYSPGKHRIKAGSLVKGDGYPPKRRARLDQLPTKKTANTATLRLEERSMIS